MHPPASALAVPVSVIVAAVILSATLATLFRYGDVHQGVRTDRWTGQVQQCDLDEHDHDRIVCFDSQPQ